MFYKRKVIDSLCKGTGNDICKLFWNLQEESCFSALLFVFFKYQGLDLAHPTYGVSVSQVINYVSAGYLGSFCSKKLSKIVQWDVSSCGQV